MPKKTKKEKALAHARRVMENARLQSSFQSSQKPQQKTAEIQIPSSSFEFKAKPVITAFQKSEKIDEHEFIAIRRDIIKTVVLAGAAIVFEYIVYLKLG